MNRKEIAQETLRIQQQGFYEYDGQRIDIATAQKHSEECSQLITPEQGAELVMGYHIFPKSQQASVYSVANEPTVKAIVDLSEAERDRVGGSTSPVRKIREADF